MRTSLRRVLDDSHVAPIAIALLLARSLFEGIHGLTPPIANSILGAILFLITAVAERELPMISSSLSGSNLLMLSEGLFHLVYAAAYAAAAWLLSRWIYGKGPLHGLRIAWSERPRGSSASSFEDSACR